MKWQSILVLSVLVLLTVLVIAVIWTQVIPQYQARAEVRVRSIIPHLVFRTEDNGRIPRYRSFVNNQVSIINSEVVFRRVLDQRAIRETQWYRNPPKPLIDLLRKNPPSPIDRLKDSLSVKHRKGTEIIDISFIDSNAEEAKLIVNTLLEQYINRIGTMSYDTGGRILAQLKDQYNLLEKDILHREKKTAELRKTLGMGTPEELISRKGFRLDETQASIAQVRRNIALLEWDMERTTTADSNNVPGANDRMQRQPKYYEDVEWRRLDANVRTMRHNIADSLLKPNHPDSARIEKELQFAEEQLKLRETQMDEQWLDRLNNPAGALAIAGASSLSYQEGLVYIEHQLARSKREEKLLADELKTQQAEFAKLFEIAEIFEKENNALQYKRELFNAVRHRKDQMDMERNAPGSIEVQTRAYVSPESYHDRRVLFTVMAFFVCLGMGSSMAFLRRTRIGKGEKSQ